MTEGGAVTIKNNMIVATVNDRTTHKDICGVVYKPSSRKYHWEEVAVLKTNGEPFDGGMLNWGVAIQDGLVYTGRVHSQKDGDSTVFVHSIDG